MFTCKASVPFPGIIAHHVGPESATGHGESFHAATVVKGQDASAYFKASGIHQLALKNGGLCTFWLGDELVLYQSTNEPLVNDDALEPSINSNADLFGSFMGTLPTGDPTRPKKRAIVERALGNARFASGLDDEIRAAARHYLQQNTDIPLQLDDFALYLVADIDSRLSGILDFNEVPLTAYLSSEKYRYTARYFFEIASEVISKVNTSAIQNTDLIVEMTRNMLIDNVNALSAAPKSNMIKAQFTLMDRPFSLASIEKLSASELKEIGTIIVATYDTTGLSLLWVLAYLETAPSACTQFLDIIHDDEKSIEFASLLVLEALRLGGSNPTALWRRTKVSVAIQFNGHEVELPPQTMLWLDRHNASRDPTVFPYPNRFDIRNIQHIMERDSEKTAETLSRNRHEINAFNMINTHHSPRKCPGRLFSVREQAVILVELYRYYDVSIVGADLSLAPHRTMPRPMAPGIIQYRIKNITA